MPRSYAVMILKIPALIFIIRSPYNLHVNPNNRDKLIKSVEKGSKQNKRLNPHLYTCVSLLFFYASALGLHLQVHSHLCLFSIFTMCISFSMCASRNIQKNPSSQSEERKTFKTLTANPQTLLSNLHSANTQVWLRILKTNEVLSLISHLLE